MATVAELVEETRRHLAGQNRLEYDRLDGAISDTTSESFTVEFTASGLAEGAYVCLDDEVMLITSVSGTTVNVLRGMLGSTAATHTDNTLIEVNPRFSRFDIKQTLKQEISSWGPGLFKAASLEVTAADKVYQAIDLTGIGDIFGVLEVRKAPASGETVWPALRHYEVLHQADTGDFASGFALQILEEVASGAIRISYAKPFDVSTFDDSTDTVTDIGMLTSMDDIPAYGAAWRLLSLHEAGRSDAYPRHISARESYAPAGLMASQAQSLKRLRDERVAQEVAKLRARYPFGGWS